MPSVVMPQIDRDSVRYILDATYYARGVTYARRKAVTRWQWRADDLSLHGTVVGRGDVYDTVAYFDSDDAGPLDFTEGECSCPIGYNCKHVAALVLTAVDNHVPATRRGGKAAPTSWARSLDALLTNPVAQGRETGTPLAVELSLSADPTAPRLLARLVKPGKNGWVGALNWNQLSWPYHGRGYRAEHLRLLRELYALSRAHQDNSAYHYHPDQKTIDLSAFGSSRLWSLLDEAEAIELPLVHRRKRLGTVPKYRSARLCLDATRSRPNAKVTITPVLCLDSSGPDQNETITPIAFLGEFAHGLVYTDSAATGTDADPGVQPLRLARLDTAIPPELQRMALAGRKLEVPAAEVDRFTAAYYPRLRRLATVISSDDTFTPPVISAPALRLHAAYHAGHDLTLRWDWVYQVGDTELRTPLAEAEAVAEHRDPAAERELLATVEPLIGELLPQATLSGIDTLRFTTETLPLLTGQPGLAVSVDGEPADYRAADDSLSIELSTKSVAGETDWFDLGVTIKVDGQRVPFVEVFTALATEQSHLLMSSGAYFSLDKPELRALRALITEARELQDTRGGPLRISRFQAGLWAELAELGVVTRQARAWRAQVEGLLSVDTAARPEVPAGLTARLRPYQFDGFAWLVFLWQHRLGGILADDMGLGKTIQTLALLTHAREREPDGPPFLILAPSSVVANWAAEAARFAPGLAVVPVTNTARRRDHTLVDSVTGADVVITSYTLFRLDFDDYAGLPWAGLVLDEAQFVKNHQSKAYQCVRRLPAPVKLAITGTPMENNLMELWSLLSITAPGLFPSPGRFHEHYARPIEKAGDREGLARLRRRVAPLMRRRTKEQVIADLPAKQEQVLEVELHPRHRKIYQTQLQRERQKVLGLVEDLDRNRFTILASLTRLRRLSLHAGLVDDQHGTVPSAKIDALLDHLAEVVDGGHRALVFSQFTGFLDLVRTRLAAAGIGHCYLDGKTTKRAAVLARFKDGADPVFLISLKAGGFGLNLTEADYCFLLDPWWNPATETQAVDRTHRIGQTRNVMVYRLIAKDTVEDKVLALQTRKAELFTSVMDEGDVFGAALSAEDIRGLLD